MPLRHHVPECVIIINIIIIIILILVTTFIQAIYLYT